ncbi:MAG: hypothetical protein R6U66_12020 [Bacteroidales bacterium]
MYLRWITFILLSTSFFANAQPIQTIKGNFDFIDKVEKLHLTFDYQNVVISKYKTETAYLEEKQQDLNRQKAGSGDSWRENWYTDREKYFEPIFSEAFFKHVRKVNRANHLTNASHQMVVRVTYMEPGFKVKYSEKSAEINILAIFYPKGQPRDTLAIVEFNRCRGKETGENNRDTRHRLIDAFGTCGKALGKYIRSHAY